MERREAADELEPARAEVGRGEVAGRAELDPGEAELGDRPEQKIRRDAVVRPVVRSQTPQLTGALANPLERSTLVTCPSRCVVGEGDGALGRFAIGELMDASHGSARSASACRTRPAHSSPSAPRAHSPASRFAATRPVASVKRRRQKVSTRYGCSHRLIAGSSWAHSAYSRIRALASRWRSGAAIGSTSALGSGPARVTPRSRSSHLTTAVLQWPSQTSSFAPLSRNRNDRCDQSMCRRQPRGTYEPSRCWAQAESSAWSRRCSSCKARTWPGVSSSWTTMMKSTSLNSSASPVAKEPWR